MHCQHDRWLIKRSAWCKRLAIILARGWRRIAFDWQSGMMALGENGVNRYSRMANGKGNASLWHSLSVLSYICGDIAFQIIVTPIISLCIDISMKCLMPYRCHTLCHIAYGNDRYIAIELWPDFCLWCVSKVGLILANIFLFTSWLDSCLWQAKNNQ